MKRLVQFFSIFFSLFLFTGCIDGEDYQKTDIQLDIVNYTLPDTATVNVPFPLYLRTTTNSSCVSNLRFMLTKENDKTTNVFGIGTYIYDGKSCYNVEVFEDSTINLTATQVGEFYFNICSIYSYKVDTVVVIP